MRITIALSLLTLVAASAAPQSAGYDTYLMPIVLDSSIEGANGSRWDTDIELHNAGDEELNLNSDVGPIVLCGAGPCTLALMPHQTIRVFLDLPGLPPAIPAAMFRIRKEKRDEVFVTVHIREDQRDVRFEQAPMVHESQLYDERVVLPIVPATSNEWRSMLRIYDASGQPAPTVLLRVFYPDFIAERIVQLLSPPPGFEDVQPSYAQIPLEASSIPGLPYGMVGRIEVEALGDLRIWAAVTVTDNATSRIEWLIPK